jgi:ABC-type multidrug transport system permease subunit
MAAKKTQPKPFGILFASMFYLAAGLYNLVFSSLFDSALIFLYALGVACIVSGVGIFILKRWGLLLAVASFPFIIVLVASTLYCSINLTGLSATWLILAFHLSLILYAISSIFSLLFLLDKRREFK